MRRALCRAGDIDPDRARTMVAFLFASPDLTLQPVSDETIVRHVRTAIQDYDLGTVGVSAEDQPKLERKLLEILREGLKDNRPGPAVADLGDVGSHQ
jgi:hypothetical protein